MKRMWTVGLLALAIGVTAVAAQQNPMRPGNWEITVDVPGTGPFTTTQCVTAAELAKDFVPGGESRSARGYSCKVEDYKWSGNRATWRRVCTGPTTLTSEGEITVSRDAYDARISQATARGPIVSKTSGKRLGDCPPGSPNRAPK